MRKRLNVSSYDTDKAQSQYLENYMEFFEPLIGKEIRLLEVGVYKGGSLLLWRDYFEKATIVGLDINPVHIDDPTGRIHVYQGQQQDTVLLDRIAQEMAPEGFDVIIDDCSHIGELTRISFWHLFDNHLKPGGLYAIEDWGTGYWNRYIDGKQYRPNKPRGKPDFHPIRSRLALSLRALLKNRIGQWMSHLIHYKQRFPSHDYGMVGFIKELVDECGMDDITRPGWGIPPFRPSKFQKMHISHGQVIIVKSG